MCQCKTLGIGHNQNAKIALAVHRPMALPVHWPRSFFFIWTFCAHRFDVEVISAKNLLRWQITLAFIACGTSGVGSRPPIQPKSRSTPRRTPRISARVLPPCSCSMLTGSPSRQRQTKCLELLAAKLQLASAMAYLNPMVKMSDEFLDFFD